MLLICFQLIYRVYLLVFLKTRIIYCKLSFYGNQKQSMKKFLQISINNNCHQLILIELFDF